MIVGFLLARHILHVSCAIRPAISISFVLEYRLLDRLDLDIDNTSMLSSCSLAMQSVLLNVEPAERRWTADGPLKAEKVEKDVYVCEGDVSVVR